MTRKVVLVTGAGGFIGRWSVPQLAARGYEVHAALSPRPLADPPVQLDGATRHAADLFDAAARSALITRIRPTHLLHFAWIAVPGLYWQSSDNYRWLDSSRHLLSCFARAGGCRAVLAGSSAEYDWSLAGVCREDQTPLADERRTADGPRSVVTPYAECKIALYRYLQEFGRSTGVSTAWGRIFFQFGPGENADRLVSSVIVNLLSGRQAPCSHGRQVRSFLHVADVGSAFAALLDSDVQGAVNVGSAEATTLAALLECIAAQIGRPDLLRLGARAAPAFEPDLLVPAVERLREEVLWQPQFKLHEGIADAIAWWRKELTK